MEQSIEQTPTSATFVITVGLLFALRKLAEQRSAEAAKEVSVSQVVRELLGAALEREAVAA